MKQIPQWLVHPPSVLENPSVTFSSYNLQQREIRDPPKSPTSN